MKDIMQICDCEMARYRKDEGEDTDSEDLEDDDESEDEVDEDE